MKRINKLFIATALLLASCGKDFLDRQPSKSLVIPKTKDDLWALMDNSSKFRYYCPSIGEVGSDDFTLDSATWASLSDLDAKKAFIWNKDIYVTDRSEEWGESYVTIFTSNVVLESLERYRENFSEQDYNAIKGTGLFHRAYALYQLSQVFMQPYSVENAGTQLGLPLRLDSDLNKPTSRSSMAETYRQIENDLNRAAELLPQEVAVKTRPSKSAAYAAMARMYLSMEQYEQALIAADNCLKNSDAELLDYNTLNSGDVNPLKRFNNEVIYHHIILSRAIFNANRMRLDTALYRSYVDNDLRKKLFFKADNFGYHSFRGSYDGTVSLFGGLALDEIKLIQAECLVRAGRLEESLSVLNELRSKRFDKNSFSALSNLNNEQLLWQILDDRRKQLLFRAIRWSDLRRLNKDPRFEKTLIRKLGKDTYSLLPNSTGYTIPIPQIVISITGIAQNER